jgi:spore coat polysaccharide biosynthesis protein SpsF (cytidylyltransferase family)
MGSTRLPGKVLAPLRGRPLLWHVLNRLRKARSLAFVGVATTTEARDDAIEALCREHAVACWRGPVDDVLHRFVEAARAWEIDPVARINADCPFLCPDAIDRLVAAVLRDEADYAEFDAPTIHVGIDVFSRRVLEELDARRVASDEREHLALLPRRHPERFRVAFAEADPRHAARPGLRLFVDEPADLAWARDVYEALAEDGRAFSTDELLRHLDAAGGAPDAAGPAPGRARSRAGRSGRRPRSGS